MNFGILPTNVEMFMTLEDYAYYMGFLGIACAVFFWLGFNNHT